MSYDKKYYEKQVMDCFNQNYSQACLSKYVLPEEYLLKINSWVQNPRNILFVCGNPGLGKTYLCTAICKLLIEREKNFRCFSETSFFSYVKSKMNENVDSDCEIKRICEAEYFILDDFGSARNMTEWQKDRLFNFIDERVASCLPTLVTSNLFLNDIKSTFCPRFVSRVRDKNNVFLEINWIDKRVDDFE